MRRFINDITLIIPQNGLYNVVIFYQIKLYLFYNDKETIIFATY